MATQSQPWRVRLEGTADGGKAVQAGQLVTGIENGVWTSGDEVRDPATGRWIAIGEHARLSEHVPHRAMFGPREVEDAETDMTPMIDVTFQLVIFFMIAATFTVQKTLDMPVPESDPKAAAKMTIEELEQENVMVKVTADGQVTVDDRPTPVDGLEQAVRDAVQKKSSADLVLDVDDQARQDVVVKVIDAAGAAQIQNVMFVSRDKPK